MKILSQRKDGGNFGRLLINFMGHSVLNRLDSVKRYRY